MMYNFVALAEENPWLSELNTEAVNAKLQAKRDAFLPIAKEGGTFWSMAPLQREACSPEVRHVEWMDIADVVDLMVTSKGAGLIPINAFQRLDPLSFSAGLFRLPLDPCFSRC